MKRFALVCLLATGAVVAHAETFVDNARVRAVEPQYEDVATPRQECTTQVVNEQRPIGGGPNYGGAVVGGVVGGLLGNQVGRGHGREAATAAGAVVGAITGDRMANNQPQQYEVVPREVTSCRTISDMQARLTGYRVSYDWRGQEYSTFMRSNPGPTLQVRVSVEPVVR
jgi:uncharacterized protein YcfJ